MKFLSKIFQVNIPSEIFRVKFSEWTFQLKNSKSLVMVKNVFWTFKQSQEEDLSIGAIICTRQEIQCLLYTRFVFYW